MSCSSFRRSVVSVPSLFVLVGLVAGCSAAASPSEIEGASAAISATEPTSQITIHGKLIQYGSAGTPFPGATVCLDGHPEPCVTSGTDGTFAIEATVADGEDLLIVASADGHTTTAFPRRFDPSSGTVEIGAYQLISTSLFHSLVQMISGQPYDATKGVVALNVASSWPAGAFLGGATVAYTPVEKVYYSADNGIPDPSLTSTTVGGHALTTIGNVSPGTVSAQVSLPGKTCAAFQGWSSDDGSIRLPVRADTIISAIAVCQ